MVQVKMPDLAGVDDAIEALLELRQAGVGAYLGGSCTETNLSAEVSIHLAVALQPDVQLAKPGMGIDEAVMMTRNTQSRLLAELEAKHHARVPPRRAPSP
jgi:methylaspartate ammonia-lyase